MATKGRLFNLSQRLAKYKNVLLGISTILVLAIIAIGATTITLHFTSINRIDQTNESIHSLSSQVATFKQNTTQLFNALEDLGSFINLSNGQIIIGRNGKAPIATFINGTQNQILVTNGEGAIILSLPQSIDAGSTPNFNGLSLNGLPRNAVLIVGSFGQVISYHLANGKILIGNSDGLPVAASITGTTDQVAVTNGVGQITLSLPQSIATTSKPTFANIYVTSLDPNAIVTTDNQGAFTSKTLLDGQVLVGSTSTSPVATTITGTPGQISVTNGPGSIVLSIPGNISTSEGFFVHVYVSSLTQYSALVSGLNGSIQSVTLINGQILIGRTGLPPLAATITGTPSQVIVTNGVGSITLSLPQSIDSLSTPTFVGVTLSGLTTNAVVTINGAGGLSSTSLANGQILIGRTGLLPMASFITGTINQINVVNGVGSITLSLPQPIAITSTPTFVGVTLSGLTINAIVTVNGAGTLSSTSLANGQLLVGSTGSLPTATTLTGTPNQVIVTNGAGSISLSLPQSLASTSTPTFVGISLSGLTTNAIATVNGAGGLSSTSLANGQLLVGSSGSLPVAATITGTPGQIVVTNGPGTITLSIPSNISTFEGLFVYVVITSLSPNSVLYLNGTNSVNSVQLTDGQILIGKSGAAPVASTITGTPGQIVVTNGPGSITLSIPSNISTFEGMFVYVIITSLAPNSVLYLNGTNSINSVQLTNGQLLIGSSGTTPVANTITGSANQIIVTNGAGTITLSLPQNIATSSSPTFAGLSLTGLTVNTTLVVGNGGTLSSIALLNGQLLIGSSGGLPIAAFISGTPNQIIVTNGPGTITLSLPQSVATSSSPTFSDITLSSLTINGIVIVGGSNLLTSTTLSNGQLLIGSAGSQPVANTISGTVNQITITNGAGTITLSLPQSIATTSSPSFTGLTVSGLTANTPVVAGVGGSLTSIILTNGQLLIGSTGALPVAGSITGTINQVVVTLGVGTISLSLPQAIASSSSPTFTGITISGLTANAPVVAGVGGLLGTTPLTNGQLLIGSTSATPVAAVITGTTSQVIVTNGAGSITLSLPQSVATTSTPTFAGFTLTGLSANAIVTTIGASVFSSIVLTNGQLLIGSTGAASVAASITGTTNQVIVTNGAGSITLSLPQSIATTSNPIFADISLTTPASNAILLLNSTNMVISIPLLNGQLLVGFTGGLPIATTITGTANQVIVTNGAGSITLSLPQNIDTGASPTFVGLTLTGLTVKSIITSGASGTLIATALLDGQLLIGSTGATPVASGITGTTNQVVVTNAAGSITLSLPQNINAGASPTFAGLTLTGLTVKSIITSGASGTLIATALTNGQLLIGSTGATPVAASITGTTSQVIVTNGVGSITLSLPQNINAGASPTFVGLTLSGLTINSIITSGAAGTLVATALLDGQLLIGSSGATPVAASITGTASQIIVTNGAGSITLSLPQSIAATSNPVFADISLTTPAPNAILLLNSSGIAISIPLLNGQILIGFGGALPVAATITGTANQVIVTNGAGSITLSLPQNINVGASPTFAGLTLTGLTVKSIITSGASGTLIATALTNGQLLIGSTGATPVAASITGTTNQVIVTNGVGSITLSLPQNIDSGASPTFTGLTLTGLTVKSIITSGAAGTLIATVLTNGQILIGSTGATPVAASITGTTSQVIVTNGVGSITLSLPQSIATTSSPSFTGLTVSGLTANAPVVAGVGGLLSSIILTNGQLLIGSASALPVAATITGTTSQVIVTNGAGSITLSLPQSIAATSTPTFAGLTLTGLSANAIVTTIGASVFSSIILTNGQLLIGSTGAASVAASITGTTSQVIVTNGAGSITLSLPQNIATTSNPVFADISLTTPAANAILLLNSTNVAISIPLTNGQLLIGSTNSLPVAATLTGTTNQVIVTIGAGSITLSLPQNINAGASPTFVGLTLSGLTVNSIITSGAAGTLVATALTNGQLLIGSTGATPVAATITGTANQVVVTNGVGSITLSLPQNINTGASPTFVGLTLSGLTVNSIITNGAAGTLVATALTNGQLLIGSSGATPVAASITGTTSQVIVTNGAGTITLSLPQSIATTSNPQFNTMTLTSTTNQLIIWGSGSNHDTIALSLLPTVTGPGHQTVLSVTDPGANAAILLSRNSILGTANQVIVTDGALSVTLSLPQSIGTGSSPTFTGLTVSGLTANAPVVAGVGGLLSSITLTNGQLLIGSSGALPVAAAITGTVNQVVVTNGAGSITLSLPQDIATTSDVTFNSILLSALATQITVVKSGTHVINLNIVPNTVGPSSSSTVTLTDPGGPASFLLSTGGSVLGTTNQVIVTQSSTTLTLSLPQSIGTGSSPSFTGLTVSGLTANAPIVAGVGGLLSSIALTNGQLLIGSSGALPVAAAITGTTSQVIVTNGAGSITLSLPQSIATTSTPTFASETLTATTNQIVLGTTKTVTITSPAPANSGTYTIPDVGVTALNFMLGVKATRTLSASVGSTLSTSESGLIFFLGTATTSNVITLPAVTAGVEYTFIVTATSDGTHQYAINTPGAATIYFGNSISFVIATTTMTAVSSASSIKTSPTAANLKPGDRLHMIASSANWFVETISTGTANGWVIT